MKCCLCREVQCTNDGCKMGWPGNEAGLSSGFSTAYGRGDGSVQSNWVLQTEGGS